MADPLVTELGAHIRASRRAQGLTQDQFARAVGVTRSAVAQWETGRAGQVGAKLARIAGLLVQVPPTCSAASRYRRRYFTDEWRRNGSAARLSGLRGRRSCLIGSHRPSVSRESPAPGPGSVGRQQSQTSNAATHIAAMR